jgi:hypothetical protein
LHVWQADARGRDRNGEFLAFAVWIVAAHDVARDNYWHVLATPQNAVERDLIAAG